jgi:NTP pyrophosphatase (non-canonical NTP hydrolase)
MSETKATSTALTISQAQIRVDDWIKTIGVRYFSELTNLAQLVEEVGELARILARQYGDQSFKGDEAKRCNLADEMADVLFVLICLANQTGVDLTAAFEANLHKKTKRDSDRHHNNPKL